MSTLKTITTGSGTSYKAARVAAAESGYAYYAHLVDEST